MTSETFDRMPMTTDEIANYTLDYGRFLVKCLREEYKKNVENDEPGDPYYTAIEEYGLTNYDKLAIMWACGVVSDAWRDSDMQEEVSQFVCFGEE